MDCARKISTKMTNSVVVVCICYKQALKPGRGIQYNSGFGQARAAKVDDRIRRSPPMFAVSA